MYGCRFCLKNDQLRWLYAWLTLSVSLLISSNISADGLPWGYVCALLAAQQCLCVCENTNLFITLARSTS